jgi:hypothetical protein
MQAVIEMVHAQPFNRLGFLLIRRKGSAGTDWTAPLVVGFGLKAGARDWQLSGSPIQC